LLALLHRALIALGLCRALLALALPGGLIPVTLTALLSLTLALLAVFALGLLIVHGGFLTLSLLLSLSTRRLPCGLVLLLFLCALTRTRRALCLALPVLTALRRAALRRRVTITRSAALRSRTLRAGTLALRGGFSAASGHGLS